MAKWQNSKTQIPLPTYITQLLVASPSRELQCCNAYVHFVEYLSLIINKIIANTFLLSLNYEVGQIITISIAL